jgi:hypothetical protein
MQADGYPTNWDGYDAVVFHVGAVLFGFAGGNGDVNRFGARFRAAASYRGVVLDGYSVATADGYSALCRVLFTWSAFESFLAICNLDQRSAGPTLDAHSGAAITDTIRRTDIGNLFLSVYP